MRRNLKKIFLIIIILVLTGFLFAEESEKSVLTGEKICVNTSRYAAQNSNLNLYSLSCALIDGDTGRVLYEKNGYEKRAMASTTKIMTLILALENGEMDSVADVSEYAASMPEVKLGVKCGEQYKLNDLLYSLILESHNDTAVVIAEHIGGSVEGFAAMMNAKAKELGLNSTYFITPNGLDSRDEGGIHSTTAVELARLLRYCVYESPANKEFIKIASTRNYTFSELSGNRNFSVSNKNAFLDMMEGVIAGKTGFTADAGYCYVCALERDGKKYVLALLGCGWPGNKTYKWKDSKTLFNYGIENYTYKDINLCELSQAVNVKNAVDTENVDLICKDKATLLLSDTDRVSFEYDMPQALEAPVSDMQPAGRIKLFVNDEMLAVYDMYPEKSIERYDYKYCINKIYDFIFY